MSMSSLHRLLIHELKDIYSAEKQLTEAIPNMVQAASSPRLKEALNDHLEVTKKQLERVSELLSSLDATPGDTTCLAMKGLISEGEKILEGGANDTVRDAAIIGAAQRVEHYEIAAYGTTRAFAEALGKDEIASVLQEILQEESDANETLSNIALKEVNPEAAKV